MSHIVINPIEMLFKKDIKFVSFFVIFKTSYEQVHKFHLIHFPSFNSKSSQASKYLYIFLFENGICVCIKMQLVKMYHSIFHKLCCICVVVFFCSVLLRFIRSKSQRFYGGFFSFNVYNRTLLISHFCRPTWSPVHRIRF